MICEGRFDGRAAVITGGASGLGREAARRIVAEGGKAILWDIDPEWLEEAVERGRRARTIAFDVTDHEAVAAAAEASHAALGRIDILVNFGRHHRRDRAGATNYPIDSWQNVVDVNLNGVFYCCRAIMPHMLANGYGRIVNVSSVAGKEGNPNASAYSASKAGVIGFTKSLGKELATRGVIANSLTPATFDSPILQQLPKSQVEYMLLQDPDGPAGRCRGSAAMVCFMASRGMQLHHWRRPSTRPEAGRLSRSFGGGGGECAKFRSSMPTSICGISRASNIRGWRRRSVMRAPTGASSQSRTIIWWTTTVRMPPAGQWQAPSISTRARIQRLRSLKPNGLSRSPTQRVFRVASSPSLHCTIRTSNNCSNVMRHTREVRGIRHIVNWHPEQRRTYTPRDFTEDPAWERGLGLLAKYGLSFDLQAYPGQFERLAQIIGRNPETQIVINHMGMPVPTDADGDAAWNSGMRSLAERPNVAVKISGAGFIQRPWSAETVRPWVRRTIELFGPERCLFASDFPTDKLFGTFDHTLSAYASIIADFSAVERRAMWGGNANRVYRLDLNLEGGPA